MLSHCNSNNLKIRDSCIRSWERRAVDVRGARNAIALSHAWLTSPEVLEAEVQVRMTTQLTPLDLLST